MASTVLPNGIIIPEKFSRDWYADLYHNWQELDNLLGGGTPKDGTLTIQKNGSTVGTFSANQATDKTIDIEVPTKTSDLTNDSNFVQSSDLATVATSGSYNDLSNKPTIPSKTSDLTNDSGFITSDDTKIPLAGSNAISGDLIPATTDSVNLGSSAKEYLNAYIKSLTINGTACGNILTHNASEFVPRSGGAVITGSVIARTGNTSELSLCGGSAWNDGASVILRGKNHSNAQGFVSIGSFASDGTNCGIEINPWGYFQPSTDNAVNCGASARRWTTVYSATSAINTSDVRLKNNIKDIDNTLLDAWGNIEPKQYKFNDATEKKGEKARYHTGYLAQDIQAECEKQGVNASEYGLFCYDEWSEQEEISEEIETEKDGKKVKEKRVIQPKREKGNMYALRYEEALVVECAYLRKCIKELRNEIEQLKSSK